MTGPRRTLRRTDRAAETGLATDLFQLPLPEERLRRRAWACRTPTVSALSTDTAMPPRSRRPGTSRRYTYEIAPGGWNLSWARGPRGSTAPPFVSVPHEEPRGRTGGEYSS
jgi:hypothetical protein